MTLRPPGDGDLEAAHRVVLARDLQDLGEPDFTLEDIRQEWTEVDAAHDVRLAADESGEVVGYALVLEDVQIGLVHPEAEGRGVGTALLKWLEGRARERGLKPAQQVPGSNAAAAALLEANGYGLLHSHWRMRAPAGAGGDRPLPEGIELRSYRPGADDPGAHALVQEVFVAAGLQDEPRPFAAWHARGPGRTTFDAEASLVAERDGEMVGVALCEDWEGRTTWVWQLAVARAAAGTGIGTAVLARVIDRAATAGREEVVLSVRTDNDAALRIYERAGMSPVWRIDEWAKEPG